MSNKRLLPCSIRREYGFSIIEVLVATVVLLVALMGFLKVAVSTTNLDGRSASLANATTILTDKYERLKFVPYATVAAFANNATETDAFGLDGQPFVPGGAVPSKYIRTTTYTPIAQVAGVDVPRATATLVTVNVAWQNRNLTQTTVITQR